MYSAVHAVFAFGHLILFLLTFGHFLRWRYPGSVPLLLVTAGLVYDNAILALGASLGHGDMLAQLSMPRFFMHAVATPLLMLTGLSLVRRSAPGWERSGATDIFVVLLTLAMIALGFHVDVLSLDLAAQRTGDLVSFGNAAASGPPIPAIATMLVLIAAGALVWRHGGGPWLLAATCVQAAAAFLLGESIAAMGNLGELVLLTGLVATDRRLSGRLANVLPPI